MTGQLDPYNQFLEEVEGLPAEYGHVKPLLRQLARQIHDAQVAHEAHVRHHPLETTEGDVASAQDVAEATTGVPLGMSWQAKLQRTIKKYW